jgi:hypothetical protein
MKTINVKTASELQVELSRALADGAVVSSIMLSYPNRTVRRIDMKRVVIWSTLAVLTVIIGISSVQAYNHYRPKRDADRAARLATDRKAADKAAAEEAARIKGISALKAQCAKDHAAFVATKGKSPSGDCNPELQAVQ